MGKIGKRTELEKLEWKRTYLSNRGHTNLSDAEIHQQFKKIRGDEVSRSSKKKAETMLAKYGKKSLVSSETVQKGRISFLKKKGFLNAEQLPDDLVTQMYYEIITPLQQAGRGNTPEEIRETYLQGLVTKGVRAAQELGVSIEGLSREQLIALSGLKKKQNHGKLSSEALKAYRRKWKITHLVNFFGNIEPWESLSDVGIKNWYHKYLFASGRLGTSKNPSSRRGITGWVTTRFGRVFTRSTYEKQFLEWCDRSNLVTKLEFNLPGILYTFEGEQHYYFPDFLVETSAGKCLVEIKARWMLSDPQTRAKLDAGMHEAQRTSITWLVLTEKELGDLDDTFRSKKL